MSVLNRRKQRQRRVESLFTLFSPVDFRWQQFTVGRLVPKSAILNLPTWGQVGLQGNFLNLSLVPQFVKLVSEMSFEVFDACVAGVIMP